MIKAQVTATSIALTTDEKLTAGRVGLPCEFSFSSEWDGLVKVVTFESENAVSVVMRGDTVIAPPEVFIAGYQLKIAVTGKSTDGAVVIPTIWGKVGRIENSAATEEYGWQPTPDLAAQIIQIAANAEDMARGARKDAEQALTHASVAEASANEARQSAGNAETSAAEASSSAAMAADNAASARADADRAKAEAARAAESADNADRSAQSAAESASSAQTSAQAASASASVAITTASGAVTTANDAHAIAMSVRDDADAGKFNGRDGYTPQKNVDYFDGHTPTESEIKAVIQPELSSLNEDIATLEGETSRLSESITEISKLFLIDSEWYRGAITSTGEYNPNSTFSNYTTKFPISKKTKKIIVRIGEDRRVSVAKYNKETMAFVERTTWFTESFSLNDDYYYVFNICTLSYEPSTAPLPIETILNDIDILIDTSGFVLAESYEKSRSFELGNKGNKTVSNNRMSIATAISLGKGVSLGTVDGIKIGVYRNYDLVSDGWVDNWVTIEDGDYIIVFKRDDDGSFADIVDNADIRDFLVVTDYTPFLVQGKKVSSDTMVDKNQVLGFSAFEKEINEKFDNIKIHSKWSGKKVAFIGDSITYGINTTKTYHQYLDEMIGFGNKYVDGVAGSCYSATSDYGTSVTPITNRVANIPTDRDLIVIFAGTNDFGHGSTFGTIADATDISFYGAIAKVITDIITANPLTRLVVMTPLHRIRGNYIGEDEVNAQGKVLKDYVDALKEVCQKYSIPFIDTNSIYGLTPRIPKVLTSYITDGLHPNANGHKLLAERIAPILETM